MWPFKKQANQKSQKTLNPPNNTGGWWPVIREVFTGGWQQNKEIRLDEVRDFFAIYSCVTLISGDISKMAVDVKRRDSNKVYKVIESGIHRLLKKPNSYQNGVQFLQWWMQSKLTSGNTIALKERDKNGKIVALHVLRTDAVQTLVSENGSVYYELKTDKLSGIKEQTVTVPASEIIHDRYQPQYHPLIGVSPIYAAALAGALGKSIQNDSHNFFRNGASLSGILTAPGSISEATSKMLSDRWNSNYTGKNAGRVAVVGDGLKFEAMRAKGIDSQIVEQLKLSAEIVASCFHVPPYKLGIGQAPSKPQEANLAYYSDCLQVLIEEFEACLNDGLEVPANTIIEFDTADLMRMDLATIYDTLVKGISGSLQTPNEARLEIGLEPLDGGDTIYMQQQNFSLEALSKRDAQDNPFNPNPTIEQAQVEHEPEPEPEQDKQLDIDAFTAKLKEYAA